MTIKIKFVHFFAAALLFLALPVACFIGGMVRLPLAIAGNIVILASLVIATERVKERKEELEIPVAAIPVAILSAVFFVYFGGVGEFSWTTADHMYRSAILTDLVKYRWPVIYRSGIYTGNNAAFIYYSAYWSIASVLGKIFGLTFARIFLVLQTCIGVLLIILGMSFCNKRFSYCSIVMLIMFSGFDYIPLFIGDIFHLYDGSLEAWNVALNIHSDMFQMQNVFNQSVPLWLITTLLADERADKGSVGYLGALAFCYSPWAVFGMIPLALLRLFEGKKIKSILTFENFAPPALVLLLFTSYFTLGNSYTNCFTFRKYDSFGMYLLSYLGFIVFEVGIWIVLLIDFRKKTSKALLISVVLPLLLLTIYSYGGMSNDLMLRGATVPMFILTILSADKLTGLFATLRKERTVGLSGACILFLYFISFITPIMLILASVVGSVNIYTTTGFDTNPDRFEIGSFGGLTPAKYEIYEDTIPVSYEYEDSFFFKYIARK